MQLHGASDLCQRCLKTRYSKNGCTFPPIPPNIFASTLKITPKPNFVGPFHAKPITQIALRKSHVSHTKVKLYSYIGLGIGLGLCQNFSAMERPGGAGPLNVNLGPPIISKATEARKLKLKTQLNVVNYTRLGYKKISATWRLGAQGP